MKLFESPIYKRLFHPILNDKINLTKSRIKNKLNLKEKKIILFYGFVRSYKGLDVLIKANKYLQKNINDYRILICGESYEDENYYIKMISKFSKNDEIQWINKYISDEDTTKYFAASDVVVLPYKNASQSGVIPLAYSYLKPVIASDIPGISEMIDNIKTGILFEKDNALDLSRSIESFFKSNIDYESNILEFRKKFSWNNFINEVLALYGDL